MQSGLTQNQIFEVCSRAFLNPPHVFLRDYLGIDPTQAVFTFADHGFNWIGVTHILFSLVFAIVIVWWLKFSRKSNSGKVLERVLWQISVFTILHSLH